MYLISLFACIILHIRILYFDSTHLALSLSSFVHFENRGTVLFCTYVGTLWHELSWNSVYGYGNKTHEMCVVEREKGGGGDFNPVDRSEGLA